MAEEKKKNIFAEAIKAGSASYSIRDFAADLESAMDKDEYFGENAKSFFNFYFHIIRMFALGHNSDDIVYSLRAQMKPKLTKDQIESHISRVESNYHDFVEILDAIFHAKILSFIKLGASEDQAKDCTDEWIISEIF